MISYNFIARKIREAGFQSCTATILFHLKVLDTTNLIVKAYMYKPAGKSLTFNGFGMEGTLTFLGVPYVLGNDDRYQAKTGQYIQYDIDVFHQRLKHICNVDIPGEYQRHKFFVENAGQLKAARDVRHAAEALKVEPDKIFYDDLVAADDCVNRTAKRPLWGEALHNLMKRRGYEWKPDIIPFWSLFKLVQEAAEAKYSK